MEKRPCVVVPRTDQDTVHASAVADRLALPLIDAGAGSSQFDAHPSMLLWVDRQGVSLQLSGTDMQPTRVDFADPALLRRANEPGARKQELVRALGLSDPARVDVVDATAGWGRDSGVLAALGFRVLMLERHPVVAELLADGLARAHADPSPQVRALASNLNLRHGDAQRLLQDIDRSRPFVVLIDPMFPERTKSAAVRKQMQFFHQLVGPDEDTEALLDSALASGAARVVLKRPRKAPTVSARKPSAVISGKSTRFDIYALSSLRH